MKPDIAIVGAGWAGLAAALTLAEAGQKITLYEAARAAGGRARSTELGHGQLDNGPHLLLGAYHSTLALLGKLHLDLGTVLLRQPLVLETPPAFRLACPPLPAPMHVLAGLAGARGLTLSEKWAAASFARRLLMAPHPADSRQSVAELLTGQPARVVEQLWEPLCVAALNTPTERASAAVFCNVLRAALGERRADSDFLLPRVELGRLLPEPVLDRLTTAGNTVRLATRVSRITVEPGGYRVASTAGDTRHTHVILAAAPQHVLRLIAALPELAPTARCIAQFGYEAIATLYVQFEPSVRLPQPLIGLAGAPAQHAFDRGLTHGQAGLVAIVASACARLPSRWEEAARAQLVRFTGSAQVHWQRAVIEKRATFACVPGLERPGNRTALPGFFLAGDYTASPFPATLESAVMSGVESAHLLLESL